MPLYIVVAKRPKFPFATTENISLRPQLLFAADLDIPLGGIAEWLRPLLLLTTHHQIHTELGRAFGKPIAPVPTLVDEATVAQHHLSWCFSNSRKQLPRQAYFWSDVKSEAAM